MKHLETTNFAFESPNIIYLGTSIQSVANVRSINFFALRGAVSGDGLEPWTQETTLQLCNPGLACPFQPASQNLLQFLPRH